VKTAMDYFLSSSICENSYIGRLLNLKLSFSSLSSPLCFFQLILWGAVIKIHQLSTAQVSLENASYCASTMGITLLTTSIIDLIYNNSFYDVDNCPLSAGLW